MTGSDAMSERSRLTATTTPTLHVDVNGTRFAYRQLGPDSEVPLVFLHHFTATIDDWDPRVLDDIAAERRVVVFDNRGIGGSAGRVPTTVEAMAEDAIEVIRALGHDRVDLLGFSLGGFIAQVIATIEPSLVRRMVLAGTGPAGSAKAGLLNRRVLTDTLQGTVRLKNPKPLLFFTRTENGRTAGAAYMDRIAERTQDRVPTTTPRGASAQLIAIQRWGAQAPMDLGHITQPVLVANGEDDRMVPTRGSFDLVHRLPDAELAIYPDAGHGGVFQYREKFVSHVLAFLA